MFEEELTEKTWISAEMGEVQKVRVLVKREDKSRGVRRREEVASDGTLARRRVQRADICQFVSRDG